MSALASGSVPPVVVFAVGNPSRGDDALGPLLAQRLSGELDEQGKYALFEVIEDFQLQIEHALDLRGRTLALFIDAGTGTPAPYQLQAVRPATSYGHTTHALSPSQVLQVFLQSQGSEPPPAYLLCVRGESFELGECLSLAASVHLEAAIGLLRRLANHPTPDAWHRLSLEANAPAIAAP